MAVQQRAAREREELARRTQNARRVEQDRMNQLGREAAALDREAAKLRQTAEEAARAKQVLSGAAAAAEQAATKIQVGVGFPRYNQPAPNTSLLTSPTLSAAAVLAACATLFAAAVLATRATRPSFLDSGNEQIFRRETLNRSP